MTRYYVEWELRTGGEFYVEADDPATADDIARAVVENELMREVFDTDDADITIDTDDDSDDEMTARYPFTYRKMPGGDIEQVES